MNSLPGLTYVSSIPADASEKILNYHANGTKSHTEYFLGDLKVGHRSFEDDGRLSDEMSYGPEGLHGWQYWFADDSDFLLSSECYEKGLAHGMAWQWDREGHLIGCYSMDHGTGLDLWWQSHFEVGTPYLSEVHSFVEGSPDGFEWWLKQDHSLWWELHWQMGRKHGIERRWNGKGGLERGFPRYYVNDIRVTKAQYQRACEKDPALPPFRKEDHQAQRSFPAHIIRCLKGQPESVLAAAIAQSQQELPPP